MSPPKKRETPEQRRLRLDKKNERQKQRRVTETPEEREKRLARYKKHGETEEERRERLAKDAARKRASRAAETAEQARKRMDRENAMNKLRRPKRESEGWEEYREKQNFYVLAKKLTMTEEEKEEKRRKKYFYRQANKEKFHLRYFPEEEREVARQKERDYLSSLTGEKKLRRQASLAKASKKRREKLKAEAEKLKEVRERRGVSGGRNRTPARKRTDPPVCRGKTQNHS